MGSLTHTVGGDSNLVSFKSAARVPIESLKCHFAPIQDGEGDPSPENVRPIRGWDSITTYKARKNLAHVIGFSVWSTRYPGYPRRTTGSSYGTSLNTSDFVGPDTELIVTQEPQEIDYTSSGIYKNGYFIVDCDNLLFNHTYRLSFKISNITSNSLNKTLADIRIANPSGGRYGPSFIDGNKLIFNNYLHKPSSSAPEQQSICIYTVGMSFTLSEFMITEPNEDYEWEPYSQTKLVNWNQWLKPLTAENWQAYNSNYIDVTFENEIATSTWKRNSSGYTTSVRSSVGTLQKNKEIWYVSYMVKSSISGGTWGVEYNGGLQESAIYNMEADKWYQCSRSSLYWRGSRNYVYISYYREGIAEHIGMIAQVKAPILINLTQMFGSGNEPTKEEFEAQCALNGIDLTSALPYDEGSVKEWKTNGELLKNHIIFPILGKNKFNINSTYAEPSNTSSSTSTQRIFNPYTYCLGITAGNTYLPDRVTNYSISDGTVSFISTNTSCGVTFFIPLLYGTYRISYTGENIKTRIICYNESGKQVYDHTSIDGNGIFSVGRKVAITGIIFLPETVNTIATASNIQIEEGITATTYEEFNPNHTVYGGYVDFAKGELVAEYASYTFTGSEDDKLSYYDDAIRNNENYHLYHSEALDYIIKRFSGIDAYSNMAKNYSSIYTSDIMFYIGTPTKEIIFNIKASYCDATVESFSQWLSEHPIQLVYKLATPISYPLNPTQLTTFLNQNNFWSNTNDITEVSYAIHDTAPIRAAKHRIAAAEPHIENTTGAIATFETDMKAQLKECKVEFKPVQDLHGYGSPWPAGCGKNQLNIEAVEYGTYNQETGLPISSSYSNQVRTTYDIAVTAGDIWVSSNTVSHNCRCFFWDANGSYIGNLLSVPNTSFTIPNDATKMRVVSGADKFLESEKWQLEKGSTATAYKPYENVCPISGWNEIDLYKSGKNLLRLPAMTRTVNGITWTVNEDGSIQVDGTASGDTWMSNWKNGSQHIDFYLKAGTYVLSRNGTPPVASIYLVARDGSTTKDIGQVAKHVDSTTFTLNQDTLVGFQAAVTSSQGEIHTTIHPQLELLSLTDYEAPNNSVIPITFPSEAETVYGGYVDLVTGEVVQEQIAKTFTILDSNQTSEHINTIFYRFSFNVPLCGQGNATKGLTMCDVAPYSYTNDDLVHWYTTTNNANGYVYVWLPKTFNSTDTITIVATLYTPQIIATLTPAQLRTLRGINNVWSNANGNIELKYWTH